MRHNGIKPFSRRLPIILTCNQLSFVVYDSFALHPNRKGKRFPPWLKKQVNNETAEGKKRIKSVHLPSLTSWIRKYHVSAEQNVFIPCSLREIFNNFKKINFKNPTQSGSTFWLLHIIPCSNHIDLRVFLWIYISFVRSALWKHENDRSLVILNANNTSCFLFNFFLAYTKLK